MTSRSATRQRRKLTPKQRVLRKHPGAFAAVCWRFIKILGYRVVTYDAKRLSGMKDTPREAWADAARRIS